MENGTTRRRAFVLGMHSETIRGVMGMETHPCCASYGTCSILAVFLSCALSAGCVTSHNMTVSDLRYHGPSSVRLILDDGGILELNRYVVTPDRIAGVGWAYRRFGEHPFAGSVPVARVLRVEPLGTTALPTVIALCASAIVFALLVVPPD
ncbi:MAG: hypothetical protein QHI48_04355 [Bacteroidota bacterium]|nr:hypothetical protein [Bacteroidota bacterium]